MAKGSPETFLRLQDPSSMFADPVGLATLFDDLLLAGGSQVLGTGFLVGTLGVFLGEHGFRCEEELWRLWSCGVQWKFVKVKACCCGKKLGSCGTVRFLMLVVFVGNCD